MKLKIKFLLRFGEETKSVNNADVTGGFVDTGGEDKCLQENASAAGNVCFGDKSFALTRNTVTTCNL